MKHLNASLLGSVALPPLGLSRAPETKEDDPGRLSAEVKGQVDELVKIVTEFRTKNDERLKQIERKGEDAITKAEVEKLNKAIDDAIAKVNGEMKSRVDDLEAKANRIALGEGGAGGKTRTPEQLEYSKKFEEFFRTGYGEQKGTADYRELHELEKKAVSSHTESDPAGGYLVRPEMETAIDEVLKEVSPMRNLATVRQIGTGDVQEAGQPARYVRRAGWASVRAARRRWRRISPSWSSRCSRSTPCRRRRRRCSTTPSSTSTSGWPARSAGVRAAGRRGLHRRVTA
jgi:hypothetical protein